MKNWDIEQLIFFTQIQTITSNDLIILTTVMIYHNIYYKLLTCAVLRVAPDASLHTWYNYSPSSSEKRPHRSSVKTAHYDPYLCFLLGSDLLQCYNYCVCKRQSEEKLYKDRNVYIERKSWMEGQAKAPDFQPGSGKCKMCRNWT